jgi:hypothetical protein
LEELDSKRLREMAQPFPVRVRKMVDKFTHPFTNATL